MRATMVCLAAMLSIASPVGATELIFNTGWSNYTTVESELCGTPALANEAADDFDLVGIVERVYVTGYNSCIGVCFPPPVTGVRIRFYDWTASGPGPLQVEHFVPAGDPGFSYDPTDIEDLDVTLPQPYLATGKTYVSVQLEFASCFYWAFWVANKDAPIGGPAYKRSAGGAWTQVTAFSMQSADLSFKLFGEVGPPESPQGCAVWSEEPSPDAPGANQTWLNDLACVGPNDIWAVGRGYVQYTASDWNMNTFAAHFDGTAWSVVPTPSPSPVPELTYCELNAVAALSPDDVWAAGTRVATDGAGYVGTHNLVLHWNGSSWQQMNAPIPASFGLQGVSGDGIYDILALAPDDVWFFGEWIRMNAQGFTFRHALAMHFDGSSFTVHEDFPIVGSNGGTILASDAAAPDDIWAVGAAGDGDPAGANQSFIFHFDGQDWTHVPAAPVPGYWHTLGDVKVLAPNDVWISGSSWAPPNVVTQFMLHWDGSGHEFVQVPFAGGTIVGTPPAMYVFGSGGVSRFDGTGFTDAHLLEGLESLASFGFGDVMETGPCAMIAAGSKIVAGDAHALIARLGPPNWTDLGHAKAGAGGPPEQLASGPLAANTVNMIALTGAAPAAPALLVVGLSELGVPFMGGTLVPAPVLVLPMLTSVSGAIGLPFDWPASVPAGTTMFFQYWIQDGAATLGVSASNAIRGVSE